MEKEDQNAEKAPQAGGDRREATPGRRPGFAGPFGRRCSSLDRRDRDYVLSLAPRGWRLRSDQVKRLKDLEAENARLRQAVSDLTLAKMILAEAAKGNY